MDILHDLLGNTVLFLDIKKCMSVHIKSSERALQFQVMYKSKKINLEEFWKKKPQRDINKKGKCTISALVGKWKVHKQIPFRTAKWSDEYRIMWVLASRLTVAWVYQYLMAQWNDLLLVGDASSGLLLVGWQCSPLHLSTTGCSVNDSGMGGLG